MDGLLMVILGIVACPTFSRMISGTLPDLRDLPSALYSAANQLRAGVRSYVLMLRRVELCVLQKSPV